MKKIILLLSAVFLCFLTCNAISPLQLKKARSCAYEWVRDYNIRSNFQGRNASKQFLNLFENDSVPVYNDCFSQNNYNFANPSITAGDYAKLRTSENWMKMRHRISGSTIISENIENDSMLAFVVELTKDVFFVEKNNYEDNRYEYPAIALVYEVYLSYDIETETMQATEIKLSSKCKPIDPFLIIHKEKNNYFSNEDEAKKISDSLTTAFVKTQYDYHQNDKKIISFRSDTLKNAIGIWGALGIDLAKYSLISATDFVDWNSEIRKHSVGLTYQRQLMLQEKNRLSLELGLGVQFGKLELTFDYSDTCNSIDPDACYYDRMVSVENYQEKIKTASIILPLSLRYDFMATKHFMLFARAGVCLNYTFSQRSNAFGTMFNRGYYDWLFDVTLDQEGIYDFGKNEKTWFSKITSFGNLDAAIMTGLGFSYCFKSFSLEFSVNYRGSVFSKLDTDDDYHLSQSCDSWTSATYSYKKFNSNIISFQLQFNHLF